MQETQEVWVPSLGREDPLEEEMATHSSILAWKVPWTAEPRELQSSGLKESDTTEQHTDTRAKHCSKCFTCIIIVVAVVIITCKCSQKTCQVSTIIILPILQMRKLRHREVK